MSDNPFSVIVEQAKRDVEKYFLDAPVIRMYAQYDYLPRVMSLIEPKLAELINRKKKKIFINPLETIVESQSTDKVIIFVPNDPDYVTRACEKFKLVDSAPRLLLIMPLYGQLSQRVVEDSGLEKKITVEEFHAEVLGLEQYLFLSPCPHCFKRVYGQGDMDDLATIARGIVKIEMLNGVFPMVHAIGESATQTKHIMQELKAQVGSSAFNAPNQFESIILIDRLADIFTPLFTQYTYGGIIEESMNPQVNKITLPEGINVPDTYPGVSSKTPKESIREIKMSDADPAFKEIRGMQLTPAVDYVNQQLQDIKGAAQKMVPGIDFNTFKNNKANAERLADMKPYLSLNLDLMAYLAKQKASDPTFNQMINFEYKAMIGLQEKPDDEIFLNLLKDEKWDDTIRLYCLCSVIGRGLEPKIATLIRRILLDRFGFDALDDIEYLERTRLLYPQPQFYEIAKLWNNIPAYDRFNKEFNIMKDPPVPDPEIDDAYGGYVPLLVRLVQAIVDGKMTIARKKLLTTNRTVYSPPQQNTKRTLFSKQPEFDKSIVRKIMVYVIGGMTSSEISMIRSLGQKKYKGSVEFYLGTTSILTGRRLVNEVCPCIAKLNQYVPPEPETDKK